MQSPFKTILIITIALFCSIVKAEYNCNICVRNDLSAALIESLKQQGYFYADTMSAGTLLKVIIYRKNSQEFLIREVVTNDSGCAFITFDYWNDGQTSVDVGDISQLDIACPNASQVIRVGENVLLNDVKFEDIDFTTGKIYIVLPDYTVQRNTIDIGPWQAPVAFAFSIITDTHIGDGQGDFESNYLAGIGYDPAWLGTDGGDGSPEHIQKVEEVRDYINSLGTEFVAVLGDITNSAERAELEHARKNTLGNLNKPYIPMFCFSIHWTKCI